MIFFIFQKIPCYPRQMDGFKGAEFFSKTLTQLWPWFKLVDQ